MRKTPGSPLLRALFVVLAAGATACVDTVLPVNVHLVTRVCTQSSELDPLAGVTTLRFTVYGPGLHAQDLQTKADFKGATSQSLPDIPAGKDRDVLVEALDATGAVVSRGETGPLDLSESLDPVDATVFLRRLGTFTPLSLPASPGSCAQLASARAGASATTLADGRVLIAGGFVEDDAGFDYLKSTELYDPRTGTLAKGPDLTLPRAYHAAVHVPGTTLTIIAGGENRGDHGIQPLQVAELYDESTNTFSLVRMRLPRTRFAAAAPADGSAVLLAGGYTSNGGPLAPTESTEVFDPQSRTFDDGPKLSAPRAELAAVGLTGGKLLVAGGWDGHALTGATELFVERPNSATFDKSTGWSVALPKAVSYALAAPLDATHVLVAGGYDGHWSASQGDSPLQQYATRATAVVDLTAKTATAGAALFDKRGQGGAVALPDGTVLVAGGSSQTNTGLPTSAATADLCSPPASTADGVVSVDPAASMADGRFLGAYTLLDDGTVLAVGGIRYDDRGKAVYLSSVEVYQPGYTAGADSPFH